MQAQNLEVNLGAEDIRLAASQFNGGPALPRDMSESELNCLFSSCIHRLRRSAMQMLRNPEDCEDALQDGLLQAFRKLNQFEGRSQFATWLYTIVRHAAGTHLRKAKCRPQSSLDDILSSGGSTSDSLAVDPDRGPEGDFVYSERSRILRRAMQELPPKYKLVMQLCDVDGLGLADAAHNLGMSKSSIKTYLFRARRLVTKRIREKYVVPSDPLSGLDSGLRPKFHARQHLRVHPCIQGGSHESSCEVQPVAGGVVVHNVSDVDDSPRPIC